MHVMIYCDDPGVGGTWGNAKLLSTGLLEEGYDITIACYPQVSGSPEGLRHIPIENGLLQNSAKGAFSRNEPEAVFLTAKPNLVVFCDSAYDSSLAAKKVCRDWGIPYVIIVNYIAASVLKKESWYKKEAIIAMAGALHVVAVSTDNLNLLQKHGYVSKNKSSVIYNGRPQNYFQMQPYEQRESMRRVIGLEADAVLCTTVARFEHRKGYQYIMKTATALKDHPVGCKLRFAWIGHDIGNEQERVTRDLANLGISSRVLVLGQRDDVRDWLSVSDIFILASESEGMPLSIIEAMGQALPIVATAVSGIPEQIGRTGILLPDPVQNPDSIVSALAQALTTLATDPAYRLLLGKSARNRAQCLFSAKRMIQDYSQLIACLTDRITASTMCYPCRATYRPPNESPFGVNIQMGNDLACVEFLKEGWGVGEGEGRWTIGNRARVVMTLPKEFSDGLVIEFEARPFLAGGCRKIGVRVLFCGRAIARFKMDKAGLIRNFELIVHPKDIISDFVDIVFELSGPSSPSSHGLSSDTRLLGLWFTRLRVNRLQKAFRHGQQPYIPCKISDANTLPASTSKKMM
ncbi:glycosyltransferase family 4 protein [Fundidesulfovibrio agrisoli]|uniref:glycosyltransferase family 4 protein n=1 Tax=Fundidesulfovibrio agrisoli TaxID=2922717 RepID=UPI001FAD8C35|nr:glycosyltransferase family 4 protein [Fundidesulfovibrio agrisoli]